MRDVGIVSDGGALAIRTPSGDGHYRLFSQTAISDSDAFTYGDAGHMASAQSGRYNNTVAFGYAAAGRPSSSYQAAVYETRAIG
ncbi:MAG: hypothetical protein U1E05_27490 [Patescibacteria group bacterium]|nr:hypothetical protein [Patescibacteria group bacterium]